MVISLGINSIFCITSSPRSAQRSAGIPSLSATLCVYPAIFPPPPTTNTALTGLSPLSFLIRSAACCAMDVILSSVIRRTSSLEIFCGSPIISLYSTVSCFSIPHLICSAVLKSTRQCLAMSSVRQSPAIGSIPYATILPSFVIEISLVPAPTSINAIFSMRYICGIATSIAAIGSSVRLATSSPASSTALYRPSTTSSGRKVAIKSAAIDFAL